MDEQTVLSAAMFVGIDEIESRALMDAMVKVESHRGDVLFREGQVGNRLYVIARGKIKLGHSSSDGRENLLSVLGPGEMFGELSLFDPGPRTATATSVADSVCYELSHQAFAQWITDHPGVAKHLLAAIAKRLRRTNESLGDLVFSDVPGRVAKALLDLASRFGDRSGSDGVRVAGDLTQEELAQLVGASRETVNKALSDFAARGWLHRDGRTIVLQDLGRLERRAR